MDVRVGIIGGTGGMGRWFAELLTRAGFDVRVSGRSERPDPEELARTSEVLIIAVPMDVTEEVILHLGPFLREEAVMLDLTSVKKFPVEAMLRSSKAEVIGCHPLFGPGVSSLAGQNVIVCPARGTRWLTWWKALLAAQGASITEMDPQEHDRFMAVIQGINHFHTLAFGLVLKKEKIALPAIQNLTTPLFKAKIDILARLLRGNPALYADLLICNDHLEEVIQKYEEAIAELKKKIAQGDKEGLVALLAEIKKIF